MSYQTLSSFKPYIVSMYYLNSYLPTHLISFFLFTNKKKKKKKKKRENTEEKVLVLV